MKLYDKNTGVYLAAWYYDLEMVGGAEYDEE